MIITDFLSELETCDSNSLVYFTGMGGEVKPLGLKEIQYCKNANALLFSSAKLATTVQHLHDFLAPYQGDIKLHLNQSDGYPEYDNPKVLIIRQRKTHIVVG